MFSPINNKICLSFPVPDKFFWNIELAPFIYEETKDAIEKPLIESNVKFDEECIKRIHELSQGHPYFIQNFAYNLYKFRKKDIIKAGDLDSNFEHILGFLGKRLFDSLLTIITPKEREIVW